jgi:hypothetical protein
MLRTIYLLMALLWTPAGVALAQDVVVGKEIPMMAVRICPTLENAKIDAHLARGFAKKPYEDGMLTRLRNPECDAVWAKLTPVRREAAIASYDSWLIEYRPGGPHWAQDPIDTKRQIPIDISIGKIEWWFCNIVTEGGERISGWAEIPKKPYVLEYLKARQP